ncbi:MAG: hypothetical protein JSC188_000666 [Candidatus Tokpelaia sp. JSC188]|nr:MAG: hypothetical protein JSC188_000666 [Candidatus Tokpelaia sp. JSC188]
MQVFLTDKQIMKANEGLLVPVSLRIPFSSNDPSIQQFRYQLQGKQCNRLKPSDIILGRFVIYAPSLIGIWAPAILACVPNTVGFVLENTWTNSRIWLRWLSTWLHYERIRLGSDVESPYLRKQIAHKNLQKVLLHLTIGHWIAGIDKARQKPIFSSSDFIFWQDKMHKTNIEPWITSRFSNRTEQKWDSEFN